jgi:hypothetical protein
LWHCCQVLANRRSLKILTGIFLAKSTYIFYEHLML